jgi:acetyltransferase-like isoleucine patch superfamily enzyme
MKFAHWILDALAWPMRLADSLAWRVRERAMRRQFGRIGRDFVFDPLTSKFVTPQLLRAGDDCFLNAFAHLSGDIELGDRVMVGPGVRLMSGNHLYGLIGHHPRFLKASHDNPEHLELLVVESDAWIGAGCAVLGGVTIGTGSILAAGSVATTDVPPFVVAAGIPARPIRRIFSDADLAEHLRKLGLGEANVAAIVVRRQRDVPPSLPLAEPVRPARFLYRGHWVQAPSSPWIPPQ